MSGFPNYDYPQNPQAPEDAAGPGQVSNQQQQAPMGQPADTSPGPFQAGNGDPNAAGGPQPGGDAKTTLWMGELEPWIDENFVRSVWFGMGEQVNVKMIRDKFSG